MNDNAVLLGLAVCVTAAYVAHQITCPGSDGAILAGVSSALVGLATYLHGVRRGQKLATVPKVTE